MSSINTNGIIKNSRKIKEQMPFSAKPIFVNSTIKIKFKKTTIFFKFTNFLLPIHFPINFIIFLKLKSIHFLSLNQITKQKEPANKVQAQYKGMRGFSKGNPLNLEIIRKEKTSIIIAKKMILNAKIKFFNLFKNKNICDFLFKNS